MSIEKIIIDTLKKGDFEEAGIEYVGLEGRSKKIIYKERGFGEITILDWLDEKITKIAKITDFPEEEINIYVIVGASSDSVWYFSVPSSFILPKLIKRR